MNAQEITGVVIGLVGGGILLGLVYLLYRACDEVAEARRRQ